MVFEINKNGNTTHQNLWDADKAAPVEKLIALTADWKRNTKINNLNLYLRLVKEQIESEIIRRKEGRAQNYEIKKQINSQGNQ